MSTVRWPVKRVSLTSRMRTCGVQVDVPKRAVTDTAQLERERQAQWRQLQHRCNQADSPQTMRSLHPQRREGAKPLARQYVSR